MTEKNRKPDAAFHEVVDAACCMVVVLRGDRTIAYFNPVAERLTGYRAGDVLGKDYFELFLSDADRAEAEVEFRRILEGGKPTRGYENAVACREGGRCWLFWNAQPLAQYEGEPAVLAIGQDITPLRQTAEELRSSEARLRAVLDTAVDGIITIDERGVIQSANPATRKIFGYAIEELMGQNVSMLMPAPYRDEHDRYLVHYLTTGEKKIIGIGREVVGLRKDGSTFPMDLGVSELRVEGRRFFTGIVRDITERKLAAEAIAERENFLNTIFETGPDCLMLIEPGGVVQRMNRTGWSMIEAGSASAIEGECVYPLIAAEDRDAFAALVAQVFQGRSGTLEFGLIGRKGTRRRMETHAVPLLGKGEIAAMLAVTRDVTEKKEAEERALQAERLAAIGQMIAGLAHESRNAFQRSQACLEMLALDLEDQPESLEMLARIQKALDHLHHLYEEVRDYAAPIKLNRRPCDLAQVWRDTWGHLEVARTAKRVRLLEETHDLDLTCKADPHALEQLFRNLFENAISACREPGEIAVAAEETCDHHGRRSISLAVRDNGPGFEPEAKQRVFEPFFTTKTKGTGLGMAIARRIVEAHGGHIEVGDSDGGALIRVNIPRDGL